MGIEFKFFEAGHGDSILVSTYEEINGEKEYKTHILIDGGVSDTYKDEIASKINDLDKLDLVVLTHIDNDHICGLIELLKDEDNRKKIKELWFNKPSEDLVVSSSDNTVSYGQGNMFNYLLEKEPKINCLNDVCVEQQSKYIIGQDIELILLSPLKQNLISLRKEWTKDDNTKLRDCNGNVAEDVKKSEIPIDKREISDLEESCIKKCNNFFGKESSTKNKSSIAFILNYKKNNKKFLFLGDADIRVVIKSLKKLDYSTEENKRLEVEFVKLSHHGSANNINDEFLNIVKTDSYIILTDGEHPNSSKYKHPDKETLALILTHKKRAENIKILFNNYLPITNKFPDELEEEEKYNFLADKKNSWCLKYDS